MQGEGRDGKGAMGRWFERILTMANFVSMHELPRKMEYLSHLLIGKRLAFVSDNRDRNLATKPLFISITGGDLQLAENKYISSFMTRLACKFIIMSNPDPNVTREKSILRRLIFARITAPKEIVLTHTKYENGLYSESGAFLAKCRDVYQELCPDHEEIKSDEIAVNELIDQTEAHYQGLFDSRFTLGGETRGNQLAEIVRQLFNNKSERDDFYQFIRQKLNTTSTKDRNLGVRIWKGFTPRYQQ
jgi:phage/plasmid-associated DNA primase